MLLTSYIIIFLFQLHQYIINTVACPGIRMGGGRKSERLFFAFQFFKGGPAQKIAEKMIFPTKKVAKYR